MPLNQNESVSQKALFFTIETIFVKENYILSHERIAIFTQVSSEKLNPLPLPEFPFKKKSIRIKLNHLQKTQKSLGTKGMI